MNLDTNSEGLRCAFATVFTHYFAMCRQIDNNLKRSFDRFCFAFCFQRSLSLTYQGGIKAVIFLFIYTFWAELYYTSNHAALDLDTIAGWQGGPNDLSK